MATGKAQDGSRDPVGRGNEELREAWRHDDPFQCEGLEERRGILTDGGRCNSTVREASANGGEAREIEGGGSGSHLSTCTGDDKDTKERKEKKRRMTPGP
jgi:hypothetical protein